jgi:hypothetical protein
LNDRHFDRSDSRSLRVAEWRNLLLYLDRYNAFLLAVVPRTKSHVFAAAKALLRA